MPALSLFLGSLFGGLLSFFTKFLTKRIAITVAIITAIAAATAVFLSAVEALYLGISAALPQSVIIGASWVAPGNLTACISAILATKGLAYVYVWNVKIWKIKGA